ncbi:MAG TPA: Crp/Fnr family transcriptional regulator [Candidatus Acidoferrum sp.]|nr:Crp/Fnr family transcriptional regulator [Candidatus Acidoferrum sp.]
MKNRTSKPIDRGLDKTRTKQNLAVENLGSATLSTPIGERRDEKLIHRLSERGNKVSYESGIVFFTQGEKSSGIFLMLQGTAKLSIASSGGRAIILGFEGPGTILGLAATILGKTHYATAEAVGPTTVVFLRRDAFLKLVQESTKTALEVAAILSERCFKLLDELSIFALSESAQQRLAAFLLGLRPDGRDNGVGIRLPGARQEDLAQMVGLSRETASRLLSRFKKRQILNWKCSTLEIRNWDALQKLAATKMGREA